jgi:hypothetical protein
VNTAREEKVLRPSFRIGNPGRYCGARWFGDLKLDRSAGFLLKNQRAVPLLHPIDRGQHSIAPTQGRLGNLIGLVLL